MSDDDTHLHAWARAAVRRVLWRAVMTVADDLERQALRLRKLAR